VRGRIWIWEDAEEKRETMRFSSKKEKKKNILANNSNNNKDINDDVNDRENEENVPLLLKPIIKNKNRAHTWTFFAILFLVAPLVALSRVGHPWLLLRVYKMHL